MVALRSRPKGLASFPLFGTWQLDAHSGGVAVLYLLRRLQPGRRYGGWGNNEYGISDGACASVGRSHAALCLGLMLFWGNVSELPPAAATARLGEETLV